MSICSQVGQLTYSLFVFFLLIIIIYLTIIKILSFEMIKYIAFYL